MLWRLAVFHVFLPSVFDLEPRAPLAGSKVLLGGILLDVLVVVAVAAQPLAAASWVPLDVAARNMLLALEDSTVVAGHSISAAVVGFIAVSNASVLNATDRDGQDGLCLLDALGPTLDHLDTLIDDSSLRHARPLSAQRLP
jgi:hypothetical protein